MALLIEAYVNSYINTLHCISTLSDWVSSLLWCTSLHKDAIALFLFFLLMSLSFKCIHSVMSNSLWPLGLQPARLLCPWNFIGKNTGVHSHFLLQGTFLTQGSNSSLLHWQVDSLPLSHQGRPHICVYTYIYIYIQNLIFYCRLLDIWASQVALVVKNPPANAGDIRDSSLIPGSGRSPGEGNGNPLQYSCLENSMNRGAWWATVHRVTQSQTWPKHLSMHTHI